jgi:hypothetical protein
MVDESRILSARRSTVKEFGTSAQQHCLKSLQRQRRVPFYLVKRAVLSRLTTVLSVAAA